MFAEIEEFLTGAHHPPDPDRVLATVLFTDIVDSTMTASSVGDRAGSACSMPTTPQPDTTLRPIAAD
jgi:class 3 adenylate cyclase